MSDRNNNCMMVLKEQGENMDGGEENVELESGSRYSNKKRGKRHE